MKKFLFFLLIILTVCSAASVPAAQEIPPALKQQNLPAEDIFAPLPRSTKPVEVPSLITAIEIKGSANVSQQEILDAVFSKVGDSLLEGKVAADIKAVYALGYFSDVSADFTPFAGGTKLVFIVKENPVLKKIEIEGNTVYASGEIEAMMRSKPGRMLNFRALREDIRTINEKYQQDGYLLARVIDVSADDDEQILSVKVIEGIVEAIVLEGNDVTQDYVILREMRTRPGRVLNEKQLGKDLRAVFNLGFFSEILPSFQPGSAPDRVVLVLKITEARTSSINFGGGYGERQGWFAFIDLSINNLFGTGQGLLLRGQSGQELKTYQLKYYVPWIFPETFGDRTSFTGRLWDTVGRDLYLTGENERRTGFDVEMGKPFAEVFRASFSYGNEQVSPYKNSSFEAYVSTTVGLALSYDTRDYWMNPTEGSFHTISTRWGWKSAGTVTQFVKYGLDLNQFFPLADKQTLALHMGAGIGVGDIPVGELYWCGGANTVRGYYPSDASTGTKKLIFNAEYRYTFNEVFQGVLFYDFGDAWSVSTPDFSKFLSGRGFGIRLNTPLGPIRLDWGVPGSKSFGEGVTHFSIGHAF